MNRMKFVEDTVTMLQEQGCYSTNGATCMYKTPDDRKCAIGLHIPDEIYDPDMEGMGVLTLFVKFPEVKAHLSSKYGEFNDHNNNIYQDDKSFLLKVQRHLHDNRSGLRTSIYPIVTLQEAKNLLVNFLFEEIPG